MPPRPVSYLKTYMPLIIFSIVAGFFWWLFYERYYKYKECIETAASSCLTTQGDNLTSGGMIWAVPALILSGIALYHLKKLVCQHKNHQA